MISRILRRVLGPRNAPEPSAARRCNVCRRDVTFLPLPQRYADTLARHGFPYALSDFETLNYREYSCPECGSSDRDRLYAMYLRDYLRSKGPGPVELLEIAPSAVLRRSVLSRPAVRHRTADLFMDGVDDRVDVTDMTCYPEERFDFVICSHVLEHVDDDRKALSELRRVLKPGGGAIVMAPVIDRSGVFDEDPSILDTAERWRRFGQDDHVRLYSKDVLLERMAEAGFRVTALDAVYFGAGRFRRHGIADSSVLYVLRPVASD